MATKSEWITTLMSEHPYGSLHSMVDGVRTAHSNAEHDVIIDGWAEGRVADEVRTDIVTNGGETPHYARYRTDEMRGDSYPSVIEFIEAYCEKEIGSDSTKWNAYVTAYNATRTKYQKPS